MTIFEIKVIPLVMKICLKTASQQREQQTVMIKIQQRLPKHVGILNELSCSYRVDYYNRYYLLKLNVEGLLVVNCQRCLQSFQYAYNNQTELAVCLNDTIAETIMEQYECIVAENEVDLIEIVTDELHLFAPEKHEELLDCGSEIRQWVGSQEENIPVTLGL